MPDPRQSEGTYRATLIGGLQQLSGARGPRWRAVGHPAAGESVGRPVRCSAGPPASWRPWTLRPRDILGPLRDPEIYERVRAADDWAGRFGVLDGLLGAALDVDRAVPNEVIPGVGPAAANAAARDPPIREPPPPTSAGVSGTSAGSSPGRSGCVPRRPARVIRFHRAAPRPPAQRRGRAPNVAGVAAECGYFDRPISFATGSSSPAWHRPSGYAHEFRNFQVSRGRASPHPSTT